MDNLWLSLEPDALRYFLVYGEVGQVPEIPQVNL